MSPDSLAWSTPAAQQQVVRAALLHTIPDVAPLSQVGQLSGCWCLGRPDQEQTAADAGWAPDN